MVTALYVPARLLDVAVVTAPQVNLSSLERLVLEAIHHGCRYSVDLAELFGLAERIVLDLLSDLWQQGYIAIDFGTATLGVSETVAARIADGWSEELKTTQTTETKLRVVQELLSGHVMSLKPWPRTATPRSTVPIDAGNSPPPVRREELVSLVDELLTLPAAAQEEGRSQILHVTVLGENLQTANTLIEIQVEAFRSSETEALTLKVTGPTTIARSLRLDMERALRDLAAGDPDHICFKQLVDSHLDTHSEISKASPALLVQQLTDLVAGLERGGPVNVADTHLMLEAACTTFEERVHSARASPVGVRPLRSVAEQHAAIEALLAGATRQVVIASPRLNYDALKRLEPHLREAVMRGVRIFVLWGTDTGEKLSSKTPEVGRWVRDFIRDLGKVSTSGEQTLPLFNVAHVSCRIAGGFVLQDYRHLLVGSLAPLRVAVPAERLASVVVEGLADDNPWIANILAWVRKTFPDPVRGQLIGLPTGAGPGARLPRPPAIAASDRLAASPMHERMWRMGWQQHVAALSASWLAGQWSAEATIDIDHRTALLSALQRKGRVLLVLSRELRSDVVSRSFIRLLKESLDAGTRVLIGVGPNGPGDDAAPLRTLAQEYPGQLIVQRSPVDAELIATDDGVLVTSFPILRRQGFFDQSKGRREPSSIGVFLRHPRFLSLAADLMEPWGIPMSFWDGDTSRPSTSAAAPLLPAIPVADVEALAALITSDTSIRPRARQLREWFARHAGATGWEALEMLEDAGMSAGDLELPVACCLAIDQSPPEAEPRRKWIPWLVSRLWEHGRFVEALLLSGHASASPQRGTGLTDGLPSDLLRLAALRGDRALMAELIDASLRSRPEDQRLALATVALEALLLDGYAEAAECLELLQPWPTPIADLARAGLEYWEAAGEQLPIEELLAAQQSSARQARIDNAHNSLLEAMEQTKALHFSFEPAVVAWQLLFKQGSTFGNLVAAIRDKNLLTAQQWVNANAPSPRRMEDMIEEVARMVMDQERFYGDHRCVFLGQKRNLYVQRLLELTALVRKWIEIAGVSGGKSLHPTEAEARFLPSLQASLVANQSAAEIGFAGPLLRAFRARVETLLPRESS